MNLDELFSTKNEEKIMSVLQVLLNYVNKYGFMTHDRKIALFDLAEITGIHLMPLHFYNPIPQKNKLKHKDFSPYKAVGIQLNASKQFSLLSSFQLYFDELADIPYEKPQLEHQYYYGNPAFCGIDANIYYAFIRKFQPAKIIEVGAGFSTMMAAQAMRINQTGTLTAIEPHPFETLKKGFDGLHQCIEKNVQDVDLSLFESLEKNDILFIDDSHVSKIGSDVNHLLLRILPILKSGVIVHVHDIFIPYEYPEEWIRNLNLFWNEQYVFQAFLTHNTQFEVLLANYFLSQTDFLKLKELLPNSPHHIGCSFWIKKI